MTLQPLYLFSQFHILVEALAAITACITWNKWKHTYFKWFVVYLLVILTFELHAHLVLFFKTIPGASVVNKIVIPVEILFINWFFNKTLSTKRKKIIVIGTTVYITIWILEKTLIAGADYFFQSLSYTIGSLFILIYLIIFFIEFVGSEKILNFYTHTLFWVALGMLFFYLGTFPFYGLYNELMKNMHIFIPYAWAATSLNYLMYILFTIGLIWGKQH